MIHLEKKQAQSGRSLLEMLGTLAVISVLTILSVAGYRFAMQTYQVNELFEQLSKTAYHCGQQYTLFQLNGDCTVNSIYQTEYQFAKITSAFKNIDKQLFEGKLTNLDKELCQVMAFRLSGWNICQISGNPTCEAETDNEISVVFHKDLSPFDKKVVGQTE